jgi:hypothetical protein
MTSDDADDELTGLPDPDSPEPEPLGTTDADPDGEGKPSRGADAMPGIPADGEEGPTDG